MSILFLLHPNFTSVSNFVRAKQFNNFPNVRFLDLTNGKFKRNIFGLITCVFYIFLNLIKLVFNRHKYDTVIIIKPWSLLICLFLKIIFKRKLYIDVNDPLHTPLFFGELKFNLLMNLFKENTIFESYEYQLYCIEKYSVRSLLIDDYSQWEDFTEVYWKGKQFSLYWYGDPEISKLLPEYIDFYKQFTQLGGILKINGAHRTVLSELTDAKIPYIIPQIKNRDDFINELSNSMFVFVPFDSTNMLHTHRGNLKAKIAMGAGNIVIAQDIPMHRRLIEHNTNGFLFKNKTDLDNLFKHLELGENLIQISQAARNSIIRLGNRNSYFQKYNFSNKYH